MKRTGFILGGLTSAAFLWASAPASALSTTCSTAIGTVTADIAPLRAAYVTYGTHLAARLQTPADLTAIAVAQQKFLTDIAALRTACAAG